MTIKQKFDQFVEELQANEKIELDVLKWKPGKPVRENEAGIKFLQKTVFSLYKEQIPEDFIYGSEVCNCTHVCWFGEFEGKTFSGELFLCDIVNMFAKEVLEGTWHIDGDQPNIKKLSLIDTHPSLGDVHAVHYNREDGKLYFNYQWQFYPLTISYKEYLEQVIINKGSGMWPFLFVDEKHLDDYTKQRFNEWLVDWNKAKEYLFK